MSWTIYKNLILDDATFTMQSSGNPLFTIGQAGQICMVPGTISTSAMTVDMFIGVPLYAAINVPGTVTLDVYSGIWATLMDHTAISLTQDAYAFNVFARYNTITNVPGSGVTLMPYIDVVFLDQATFLADTDAISIGDHYTVQATPTFNTQNGGTLLVDNYFAYSSAPQYYNDVTINNMYHFYATSANITGVEYGLYLNDSNFDYSIYSNSGDAVFWNGDVGIGRLPTYALDVVSGDAVAAFFDAAIIVNTMVFEPSSNIMQVYPLAANSIGYFDAKGTGTGYGVLRAFNSGNTASILVYANSTKSIIEVGGTSDELQFVPGASVGVSFFDNATAGETPVVSIEGYKTGDAQRTLQLGIASTFDDTAYINGPTNILSSSKWRVGPGSTINAQKGDLQVCSVNAGDAALVISSDRGDSTSFNWFFNAIDNSGTNYFTITNEGTTAEYLRIDRTTGVMTLNNGGLAGLDFVWNWDTAEGVRFDATNGNVGIGVSDPDTRLEVLYAGDQLKLSYDGTDNAVFAVDTNGDLTITASGDEIKVADWVRHTSASYRRYYHLPVSAFDPGASGATFTAPSANTVGGYLLDAATEILYFDSDIHADWDGASDIIVEIYFAVNVDNTGGGAGDTVDLKLVAYYNAVGDTASKTQTQEVATVVGASAQYKVFKSIHTLNWDETDNVIEAGDIMGFALNLETDTSEVDNIIVLHGTLYYNTAHVGIESGDV